jgi:nucleoside-diphosphate-sugar epimerase
MSLAPSIPEPDLEHILAHTPGVWEMVRGRNLFITGGTGFFGRWILESFAHANRRLGLGAHATVLTRRPEAFAAKAPALAADPALHFVSGDVRQLSREQILPRLPAGHSGEFPIVIHAATESTARLYRDDPLGMFDIIEGGTRMTLDFAVASGARRFLLTSSGGVYGRQPPELTHIPETYPGAPDCGEVSSVYGEAKRAAELLCTCYFRGRGLETVAARGFAFVGPLLPIDVHFAVGNFIRDLLDGGPIRVGGDGSPFRSYLYAADLAAWLWTMLIKGEPGAAYNVGSSEAIDIASLAHLVAAQADPPREVVIARRRTPGAPAERYVPDVRRAESRLGLRMWIDLKEAIHRTLEFHRALRK